MIAAPRVTVLVAVYNGERFVAEAIESVLAQTFGDFELVAVDDGSIDSTAAILAGYADRRLRVVRNDRNVGVSASRNRGLGAARGNLVACFDADDVCEPRRLEHQVAFLDAQPAVALVGGWYTDVDASGALVRRVRLPTRDLDLRWALLFSAPFAHSSVTFRRTAICDVVGGYDESLVYSHDYDLYRRVAARFEVANIPEFLLRLRASPWSLTARGGERALEGPRLRLAEVARLLGWPGGPADEARFRALRSLVLDAADDGTVDAVERAAEDLLELHAAFRDRERLSEGAAAAHQAAVRSRAAERLHDMAYARLTAGDRSAARRLLACARRVRQRAVPTRRQLGLYARLLARRVGGQS